jgi:hypothetical protein
VCFARFFWSEAEVKTVNRDYESLRELKEAEVRLKELYRASHRGGRTWRATGAVLGLAGGAVAAILGALLSAGAWALGDEANGLSLHSAGNILLLLTIPLLIVGAHCLDLLENQIEQVEKDERVNSDSPITDMQTAI